ncbi:DNA topoisomerase III [Desulfitobacterium dichloroeliminans LMG P-21439]|uniref:DNA topoisomerase 3 n=1 Tax=Desulfitobacterium dichloroeliminans (strain LMG P-21439 / DCA1) TaxID=871963 RepID=L0FAH1_DESDL|nr:DNA topoisomerase III [Desulfitobacterium dichloroeliminans]AGA70819.1 DNA topoisomerase III [Desulfitobacterium dichloroeliminans LMG P-21439]
MGKSLVLTEKPSVGRDIAKLLGCNQKGNGCFIGSRYIVTWALGHLVTLAEPEAYGDQYKTWRLEDLPMLPKQMELVVIKETSKQYSAVKQLLRQPDVEELIIATDAGREGELVARWIIQKAGWRKPIKRLWISSQTDKAIKEGFNNLKPGKAYESLYAAAECRAQADWYVGLNVTRALTCKYNAQLSAGRVQTPTLALVVEREKEIQKFVPKDYWTIHAQGQGYFLRWQDKSNGQSRIFDEQKVEKLLQRLTGKQGRLTEIKKEAKKDLPPQAYDLTELQRDANRKYGYSAKRTSSIMQQLYEQHKLVTYPRTDSRYLTDDIVATLPERLKSIAVGPYSELTRRVLRTKIVTTKRLVDNSKVTDHHAIIPTEQAVFLGKLSQEEARIYDLIVRRFIAVLSPAFEYEQTTIKVDIQGEVFTAKGKIMKSKGWRMVYEGNDSIDEEGDQEDQEQSLPDLKANQEIELLSIKSASGKTKPPKRYTEATLLSAMEHPGQRLEDAKLRETLEKTSGLGTPATRADIIEKLFNSFYMERNGKEITPTSKGIQLVGLVPAELKSPELTAKWEQQLHEISKGREDQQRFIQGIKSYATQLVGQVVGSSQTFRHDNMTRAKCPECGKFLLQVKGKRGEMLVCQDRECGYRQGLSVQSNARCPQCHKKMELRGEGENKLFTCGCGYREKLSAFNKRKEQEGKGSYNKKEVNQFLQKQKEAVPVNTALADALAKLKLP